MEKEILIEPMIYHGPGGCPYCSGPLAVADSEITLMEVDKEGNPLNEDTVIRCEAICLHCAKKIPVMRWQGKYIQYSESSKTIQNMKLEDRVKDRINKLNSSSDKSNPFGI